MTAKEVEASMERYFCNGVRYMVSNVFFFGNRYGESDMLILKESNGYCYDIEIKVSRGDFFQDFKKEHKHRILEHGFYFNSYRTIIKNLEGGPYNIIPAYEPVYTLDRPNRFYYAVPENLIKKEEVPSYAGLFYIRPNGTAYKVKEARLLHSLRLDDAENTLCRKFYFHYRELKSYKEDNGVNRLKTKISKLELENEKQAAELTKLRNELFLKEIELKTTK